jgi:undecaprenyl diphosphate synthase
MLWRKKKKESLLRVSPQQLRHIAFIMDGNGRWATKRGLPRESGHVRGVENFRRVVTHCRDVGISVVTVYAFSTENWSRPEREVNAIMNLLDRYFDEAARDAELNRIRYRFIGDISVLRAELREKAERLKELTAEYPLTLNIALNYGGRDEITRACNRLLAAGKSAVTEADLAAAMDTAQTGDPDFIVRTGGDTRISNFLLWQSAYAEFYFTKTLWPDLSEEELDQAILDFLGRHRRFGGVR